MELCLHEETAHQACLAGFCTSGTVNMDGVASSSRDRSTLGDLRKLSLCSIWKIRELPIPLKVGSYYIMSI